MNGRPSQRYPSGNAGVTGKMFSTPMTLMPIDELAAAGYLSCIGCQEGPLQRIGPWGRIRDEQALGVNRRPPEERADTVTPRIITPSLRRLRARSPQPFAPFCRNVDWLP